MEEHHTAYIAIALVAIFAAGGAVMILGEGTGAATFNPACYDQCRSHFCDDDGSLSRTQAAICNHNCLDSCIAK